MSLQKSFIYTIAQAHGIPSNKLSEEIASALASDAEYRIREIIQDAAKFMKHGKRSVLKCEDVNYALSMKNVQPLYGYQSNTTAPKFHLVNHTNDLYFLEDAEIELKKDSMQVQLPKVPIGPAVTSHWLAVQGVQPKIPQNPVLVKAEENKKKNVEDSDKTEKGPHITDQIQVKKQVKHVLSNELVLYYEKATEAIKNTDKNSKLLLEATYKSLSDDPGLGNLVPYLVRFITEECVRNLTNLVMLERLMRAVKCLLINPNLHIELYLHQLMPIVLTCLVGKKLCRNSMENHWKLRDFAASIIAYVCSKFGANYHTLQPRITKTLLHAFLDPSRPRTTHYGAIVAIGALGPSVVQLLLLEPVQNSNVAAFCRLLEPELRSDNNQVRFEAQMCFGALLEACSTFFVRLSRFFSPVHDDTISRLKESLPTTKQISEDNNMDIDSEVTTNQQQQQNEDGESSSAAAKQNDLESYKLSDLTRDLRERMNSMNIPEDINERYQEVYSIFGEAVLPYISYDIMSVVKSVSQLQANEVQSMLPTSTNYESMFIKDMFL